MSIRSALSLIVVLVSSGFTLAQDKKPQPAPEGVKKPAAEGAKAGLPPEFAELRRLVEEAAKKGENVDAIKKQLDELEKALTKTGVKTSPDGAKPKPAPDGGKPAKPGAEGGKTGLGRTAGKIVTVNAAAKTVTLARKGDGGLRENEFKLAADAVITIDGKPGKLESLKADQYAEVATAGEGKEIKEISVSGVRLSGLVKAADAASLTFATKAGETTVKLLEGAKVIREGKVAKLSDFQAGDRVLIVMASDDSGALLISDGTAAGDKTKPGGVKPNGDKPKPEK